MLNRKWELSDKNILFLLVIFSLLVPFIAYFNIFINDKLFFTGDGISFAAIKFYIKNSLMNHEFPLWCPYLSNGVPLAADIGMGTFYPIALLLSPLSDAFFIYIFYGIHLAIGASFSYLYFKEIGCSKSISLVAAIIYTLSIHHGGLRKDHMVLICVTVYLPMILYFIEKYLKTGKWYFYLFIPISMACQFLLGFIQTIFYTDVAITIYFFMMAYHYHKNLFKAVTKFCVIVITYLGLICVQLLPTLELLREYGKYGSSSTSFEYFKGYSVSFYKLLMMYCPNIFSYDVVMPGGPSTSSGMDIELFLGSVVLVIVIFAIRLFYKRFIVKLAIGFIIFTFIFSANAHIPLVSNILYLIPVINSFRVSPRILFIFIFFAYVLFAVGLQEIKTRNLLYKLPKNILYIGIVFTSLTTAYLYVIGNWNIDSLVVPILIDVIKICLPALFALSLTIVFIKVIEKYRDYESKYNFLLLFITIITIFEIAPYTFTTGKNDNKIVELDSFYIVNSFLKENDSKRLFKVWDCTKSMSANSEIQLNRGASQEIPTLNAYLAFNNPRLYKLISLGENAQLNASGIMIGSSIADINIHGQQQLLSMLGVKYILDSDHIIENGNYVSKISISQKPLVNIPNISVPNVKTINAINIPLALQSNTTYKIVFDMQMDKKPASFHIDFYGGPNYDFVEQERDIGGEIGRHVYARFINSGNIPETSKIRYFRILTEDSKDIKITNLTIAKVENLNKQEAYKLVAEENNRKIYENVIAKPIIYTPQRVQNIDSFDSIYNNQLNYDLADVAYVINAKDRVLNPQNVNIDVQNMTNNTVTAKVSAKEESFINFSQNYYPGWKAYVNGNETPIFLVNGLIQGINIPKGKSTVVFHFQPNSVFVGAGITAVTLLLLISYSFILRKQQI